MKARLEVIAGSRSQARERAEAAFKDFYGPPAGLRDETTTLNDCELAGALGEWMDRNLASDMPAMSSEGFYRLAAEAVSEVLWGALGADE